jgi:hypothetical protein
MPFPQSVIPAPLLAFIASFASLHRLHHCIVGSFASLVRHHWFDPAGLAGGIEPDPEPF